MSEFDWSDEKSRHLERTRGMCFEDIVVCIQNGDVIDVIRHPNQERYPRQNMMVINVDGYVWLVPYVKHRPPDQIDDTIFGVFLPVFSCRYGGACWVA